MRVAVFLAAVFLAVNAKPGGYYQQQYNYSTSSSSFKNNELQHKTDDEGYYSKAGDLEGRVKPKVASNSEHFEYVNPKLREGSNSGYYDAGADFSSRGNLLASGYGASSGYQTGSRYGSGLYSENLASSDHIAGATGVYGNFGSGSSQSYSYGSSNLQSVAARLQNDLQHVVQDAMRNQYSYRVDISELEAELRRNLTAKLNELLQEQYGTQTIREGQSYSLVGGRLQARPNYVQQDLENLQRHVENALLQQLRTSYSTSSHQSYDQNYVQYTTTYRPTPYRPIYPNLNAVTTPRSFPEYTTKRIPYNDYYTPVANPLSITTIASNIQRQLDTKLNTLLDEAQSRYFSETSGYSNYNIDEVLERLRQELKNNVTYLLNNEIRNQYGTQMQRDNYMYSVGSGGEISTQYNYSVENLENLRRQIETNLLSKLNRDFESARQRWTSRQQVNYGNSQSNNFPRYYTTPRPSIDTYYRPTSASIVPSGGSQHISSGSQSSIYGTSGSIDQLQRQIQTDLSRQLQAAIAQNKVYSGRYTENGRYGGSFDEAYRRLWNELQRNLTQQMQRFEAGSSSYSSSYAGISDAQLASLKSQVQQNLASQLQQGLQSFEASASFSASSSSSGGGAYGSSSSNDYYRQARGSDGYSGYGQYQTVGGYHLEGEDCQGDDPNHYHRAKRSYRSRPLGLSTHSGSGYSGSAYDENFRGHRVGGDGSSENSGGYSGSSGGYSGSSGGYSGSSGGYSGNSGRYTGSSGGYGGSSGGYSGNSGRYTGSSGGYGGSSGGYSGNSGRYTGSSGGYGGSSGGYSGSSGGYRGSSGAYGGSSGAYGGGSGAYSGSSGGYSGSNSGTYGWQPSYPVGQEEDDSDLTQQVEPVGVGQEEDDSDLTQQVEPLEVGQQEIDVGQQVDDSEDTQQVERNHGFDTFELGSQSKLQSSNQQHIQVGQGSFSPQGKASGYPSNVGQEADDSENYESLNQVGQEADDSDLSQQPEDIHFGTSFQPLVVNSAHKIQSTTRRSQYVGQEADDSDYEPLKHVGQEADDSDLTQQPEHIHFGSSFQPLEVNSVPQIQSTTRRSQYVGQEVDDSDTNDFKPQNVGQEIDDSDITQQINQNSDFGTLGIGATEQSSNKNPALSFETSFDNQLKPGNQQSFSQYKPSHQVSQQTGGNPFISTGNNIISYENLPTKVKQISKQIETDLTNQLESTIKNDISFSIPAPQLYQNILLKMRKNINNECQKVLNEHSEISQGDIDILEKYLTYTLEIKIQQQLQTYGFTLESLGSSYDSQLRPGNHQIFPQYKPSNQVGQPTGGNPFISTGDNIVSYENLPTKVKKVSKQIETDLTNQLESTIKNDISFSIPAPQLYQNILLKMRKNINIECQKVLNEHSEINLNDIEILEKYLTYTLEIKIQQQLQTYGFTLESLGTGATVQSSNKNPVLSFGSSYDSQLRPGNQQIFPQYKPSNQVGQPTGGNPFISTGDNVVSYENLPTKVKKISKQIETDLTNQLESTIKNDISFSIPAPQLYQNILLKMRKNINIECQKVLNEHSEINQNDIEILEKYLTYTLEIKIQQQLQTYGFTLESLGTGATVQSPNKNPVLSLESSYDNQLRPGNQQIFPQYKPSNQVGQPAGGNPFISTGDYIVLYENLPTKVKKVSKQIETDLTNQLESTIKNDISVSIPAPQLYQNILLIMRKNINIECQKVLNEHSEINQNDIDILEKYLTYTLEIKIQQQLQTYGFTLESLGIRSETSFHAGGEQKYNFPGGYGSKPLNSYNFIQREIDSQINEYDRSRRLFGSTQVSTNTNEEYVTPHSQNKPSSESPRKRENLTPKQNSEIGQPENIPSSPTSNGDIVTPKSQSNWMTGQPGYIPTLQTPKLYSTVVKTGLNQDQSPQNNKNNVPFGEIDSQPIDYKPFSPQTSTHWQNNFNNQQGLLDAERVADSLIEKLRGAIQTNKINANQPTNSYDHQTTGPNSPGQYEGVVKPEHITPEQLNIIKELEDDFTKIIKFVVQNQVKTESAYLSYYEKTLEELEKELKRNLTSCIQGTGSLYIQGVDLRKYSKLIYQKFDQKKIADLNKYLESKLNQKLKKQLREEYTEKLTKINTNQQTNSYESYHHQTTGQNAPGQYEVIQVKLEHITPEQLKIINELEDDFKKIVTIVVQNQVKTASPYFSSYENYQKSLEELEKELKTTLTACIQGIGNLHIEGVDLDLGKYSKLIYQKFDQKTITDLNKYLEIKLTQNLREQLRKEFNVANIVDGSKPQIHRTIYNEGSQYESVQVKLENLTPDQMQIMQQLENDFTNQIEIALQAHSTSETLDYNGYQTLLSKLETELKDNITQYILGSNEPGNKYFNLIGKNFDHDKITKLELYLQIKLVKYLRECYKAHFSVDSPQSVSYNSNSNSGSLNYNQQTHYYGVQHSSNFNTVTEKVSEIEPVSYHYGHVVVPANPLSEKSLEIEPIKYQEASSVNGRKVNKQYSETPAIQRSYYNQNNEQIIESSSENAQIPDETVEPTTEKPGWWSGFKSKVKQGATNLKEKIVGKS